MIEIRVSSDEEQVLVGLALVTGALWFGDWPYLVTRARPSPGPGGSIGAGTGSGTAGTSTERLAVVEKLRPCCATGLAQHHRDGCDPPRRDRPVNSAGLVS